jgi:hypothetical protein
MIRRSALLSFLLLGSLGGCSSRDDMSPESLPQNPDPVAEERRLKRPPPVRTGISSDPDNPNGAPGKSIGTSPSRY